MTNKAIIFFFLVIFWAALSAQLSAFFIIGGLASCLLCFYIAIKLGLDKKIGLKPQVFKYFIWLGAEVAKSAFYVLKLVWTRNLHLASEFVELEVGKRSDVFYMLFGNSITLTPGTVTVYINENISGGGGKIYAHALTKKTADDLKSGAMLKKVTEISL